MMKNGEWTPDVCLYHFPCMDGWGAAWVVQKRFPMCVMLGVNYKEVEKLDGAGIADEFKLAGKDVLIVDFSFKQAQTEELSEIANSIVILDHHKSAEAELQRWAMYKGKPPTGLTPKYVALFMHKMGSNVFASFDMNRSGAVLAWDFCFDHENPPKFLRMIEDRDLWRFKIDGSRELHEFLAVDERAWKLGDWLMQGDAIREAVRTGRDLLRYANQRLESVLGSRHWLNVLGHRVIALNAPYFMASDGGNKLLGLEPEADFSLVYSINGGGISCSFRSENSRVDVSEVARIFGGGGHRNAAGATVTCFRHLRDGKAPDSDNARACPVAAE